MLRLPHQVNLMIDSRHIWNVTYNARSSSRHRTSSPNTAPATQYKWIWGSGCLALSTSPLQDKGLFWELNPGPLAPEARIMPLDQTASDDRWAARLKRHSLSCYSFCSWGRVLPRQLERWPRLECCCRQWLSGSTWSTWHAAANSRRNWSPCPAMQEPQSAWDGWTACWDVLDI